MLRHTRTSSKLSYRVLRDGRYESPVEHDGSLDGLLKALDKLSVEGAEVLLQGDKIVTVKRVDGQLRAVGPLTDISSTVHRQFKRRQAIVLTTDDMKRNIKTGSE